MLYLAAVRHAFFLPGEEWKGHQAAQTLAGKLYDHLLRARVIVPTSPVPRAQDTANNIAAHFAAQVIVDNRLGTERMSSPSKLINALNCVIEYESYDAVIPVTHGGIAEGIITEYLSRRNTYRDFAGLQYAQAHLLNCETLEVEHIK